MINRYLSPFPPYHAHTIPIPRPVQLRDTSVTGPSQLRVLHGPVTEESRGNAGFIQAMVRGRCGAGKERGERVLV